MITSVGCNTYNNKFLGPQKPGNAPAVSKYFTKDEVLIQNSAKINFGKGLQENFSKNLLNFLSNAFNIKPNILNKSKTFGLEEYKALSQADKVALRKSHKLCPRGDIKDIMTLSDTIQYNLNKKFPNGYTFVSIGRTPSIFAKLLEYQGLDTKICPISDLKDFSHIHSMLPPKYVAKYGEFLKKIGISKESVEVAKKPFVFVDYTFHGTSLQNFEKILARDEIGIKGKNAVFLSLNEKLLEPTPKTDARSINLLDHYFLNIPQVKIKDYAPAPQVSCYKMHKVEKIIEKYKQTKQVKLMQFHLIDYLNEKGLLKPNSN